MRRFRIKRRRLAGLALLPATAIALTGFIAPATGASTDKAEISAGTKHVRYGKHVRLAGRFADAPNSRVDLRFRRAGAKKAVHVESTRTNKSGRYAAKVRPHRSGRWHAALGGSRADTKQARPSRSRETLVRVRARIVHPRVVHRDVSVGHKVKVRGHVVPGGKRRVVVATHGDRKKTWSHANGKFAVRLKASHTGTAHVRVRVRSNKRATGAHHRAGHFTAYRQAVASWYSGSGAVACPGYHLDSSTIGVANKSLPCGTKVKFRYHGHHVTAPVIDRGPYVGGRDYDLTYAAKQRLHFPGVATLQASK